MIKENKPISFHADQYGSPTSADLVAKITFAIINKIKDNKDFNDFGTFNIESQGKISPFIFACEVLKYINFNHQSVKKISRSKNYSIGLRPQNSKLNTSKIQEVFGVILPNWKVQLRDILAENKFYEN
jgi:dTDP-4-dehydrorhamnose reductase